MGMDLVPVTPCAHCGAPVDETYIDADGNDLQDPRIVHWRQPEPAEVCIGHQTTAEWGAPSYGEELELYRQASHYNWSGWRRMAQLLSDLGCDISHLAGMNDGDVIPDFATAAYGHALASALEEGRIASVEVEDDSYFGGKRTDLEVVPAGMGNLTEEERRYLTTCAGYWLSCGSVHQY